ncbi:uncharacterized protein LOC116617269 isoform X2 [Nematostella vectensis]|nr:uncharacterized protein LOC116617269 isoform X2 [Nematostella vectensis]
MSKVLVLFTKSDTKDSKKLRDYLQVKIGSGVNLTTEEEIIAADLDTNNELTNTGCVLLVSSKQSYEFIKSKTCEKTGEFVVFNGKLVQEHIEKKSLLERLIVVQFGRKILVDYIPPGFDNKRVFPINPDLLNDELSKEDVGEREAVLNQIIDTIKGTLSLKLSGRSSDKPSKHEKGNCSQM